jgi:hypothetical protein
MYTIVDDHIDRAWLRHLHILANLEKDLDGLELPAHARVKRYRDDLRIHHIEASYPLRQIIRLQHPDYRQATWTMAAWWFGKDKVIPAMLNAGVQYALETGQDPQVAFIRALPRGADEFVDVHGMSLVQADWVPDEFVAVTRGGTWQNLPDYL